MILHEGRASRLSSNGLPWRKMIWFSIWPVARRPKTTRANLDVKRAVVAIGDAVKLDAEIGDDTGQQIETADGRFGTCRTRSCPAAGEAFHQRHDVDAAFFQYGAGVEVNLVHGEIGKAVGTVRLCRSRKDARTR